MEIKHTDVELVVVAVERTIAVGSTYRINPSYGYAGVEPGVIKVTKLVYNHMELDPLDENDIAMSIESYVDAHLSLYDKSELDEQKEYLANTIWVCYQYQGRRGLIDETYVFPLEEFVDHISQL